MLLVRLAVMRGGGLSAIPLYCQHGSVLSRQPVPSQQCSFCSAVPLKKSKILAVPLSQIGWCQTGNSVRFSSSWTNRTDRYLRSNRELILTLSLGAFIAYFLFLRQPSDIDEHLSRPIWERVPGIDPERAEQMMEMDKFLGIQVDRTGLEEYKQKYYAEKLQEFEKEKQAEKKHRELREAAKSHYGMLQDFADSRYKKD